MIWMVVFVVGAVPAGLIGWWLGDVTFDLVFGRTRWRR